jgi:hypothetical protein
VLKNIDKKEKSLVLKLIKNNKGVWTNPSMYASSCAGDFSCKLGTYLIEEIFENISNIQKYI